MSNTTLTLALNSQLRDLFQRYEAHTQVTPEQYVEALLAKTLPTLQAVVEALDEAGGDSEAMAQLFASKMAQMAQPAAPAQA
ncbi:conserved protein of unknown function [Pseudomonas marincola]|uniref:Uncharacterized protein n=1 Tax=Pseudomonas marincola TaxID=437900 RepID=A0A653E4L5_9PSED|nr:hypothetical protein [Pseudomonas marincola]CAE6895791.1 conserved protein of unknown function [Pseudomonas marincola]